MTSYIPEQTYGELRDADGYLTGKFGLVQWPAHLQPQPEPVMALTKKGEAYASTAVLDRLPTLEIDGGTIFLTMKENDRLSIATTVERLIDMLDAMEPDFDLEETGDDEPSIGWANSQQGMGGGSGAYGPLDDEREDACEDEGAQCEDEGACIQSQPHDALDEGNDEPFLGWSERQSEVGGVFVGEEFPPADGRAQFDGDGAVAARQVLGNLALKHPKRRVTRPTGFCSGSYQALRVDGLNILSNKGQQKADPDELTIIRPGVAVVSGYKPDNPLVIKHKGESFNVWPTPPYELKDSDFARLPWADNDGRQQ